MEEGGRSLSPKVMSLGQRQADLKLLKWRLVFGPKIKGNTAVSIWMAGAEQLYQVKVPD